MPVLCWLLASPCLLQMPVLVLVVCPCPGATSGAAHQGCCAPGSDTDLNVLSWVSGQQWSLGQVSEGSGACPAPTTATPLLEMDFQCCSQNVV